MESNEHIVNDIEKLKLQITELEKAVITAKSQAAIALAGSIFFGIILVLALILLQSSR